MSTYQEHRIYKHLGKPIRIMGFTMDEFAIGIGGVVGALILSGNWFWQVIFLCVGVGAPWVLKRIKKQKLMTGVQGFLYWHGFYKPSKHYPHFNKRVFLP